MLSADESLFALADGCVLIADGHPLFTISSY
jgi:hypothetical protein